MESLYNFKRYLIIIITLQNHQYLSRPNTRQPPGSRFDSSVGRNQIFRSSPIPPCVKAVVRTIPSNYLYRMPYPPNSNSSVFFRYTASLVETFVLLRRVVIWVQNKRKLPTRSMVETNFIRARSSRQMLLTLYVKNGTLTWCQFLRYRCMRTSRKLARVREARCTVSQPTSASRTLCRSIPVSMMSLSIPWHSTLHIRELVCW